MKPEGPQPLDAGGFVGQRADERLAQEQDLLARMSHELRTPLNAIQGYTEMLAEDKEPDHPDQHALRAIQGATRRLLALVESVLDLNQLRTGRFQIEPRPFRLAEVVEQVRQAVAEQAERSGTAVRVDVADLEVTTDLRMVRQILFNLADNAARFTHGGNVTLRVGPSGPGGFMLVVEDDGIGMTPAQIEAATRPFWQADASTTRRYDGAGMGLAVCRGMAVAMGGSLTARSTPGVGTCFCVELPPHP
ncbi:MAG: HAMP domain-containing histidine kinase [Myxococcales bacterium]|nr:HAMP domain-containing histidine kinase [Myxococcales bacterium]